MGHVSRTHADCRPKHRGRARTGALPPIGHRIVAAEQRGAKIKKKLEIDPLHADTVRLIYRLFLEGDGVKGPMGVKAITCYLNERRLFTRDGGRWPSASRWPTRRSASWDQNPNSCAPLSPPQAGNRRQSMFRVLY